MNEYIKTFHTEEEAGAFIKIQGEPHLYSIEHSYVLSDYWGSQTDDTSGPRFTVTKIADKKEPGISSKNCIGPY